MIEIVKITEIHGECQSSLEMRDNVRLEGLLALNDWEWTEDPPNIKNSA